MDAEAPLPWDGDQIVPGLAVKTRPFPTQCYYYYYYYLFIYLFIFKALVGLFPKKEKIMKKISLEQTLIRVVG